MGYMYTYACVHVLSVPGDSALVAYMYIYVQYMQITKHFIHACVVHRKQCVQSDAMNFESILCAKLYYYVVTI